jgi:hypothetical protein
MTRTLLATAAVVLGLATGTQAQTGPIHRGIIYDHTGTPMPGAVVTITHPQDSVVRVVITDQWGEYVVRALDPRARYDVEVSHPHFRRARLRVVPAGYVNVTLKPRKSNRSAAPPMSVVARR